MLLPPAEHLQATPKAASTAVFRLLPHWRPLCDRTQVLQHHGRQGDREHRLEGREQAQRGVEKPDGAHS